MTRKYITLSAVLLLGAATAGAQPNVYTGSSLPADPVTGIVSTPLEFNQSPNTAPTKFNYIRKYIPLVPMASMPSFDNTAGQPVLVNTTFNDGFGNPMMNIARTNHSNSDVVTPYYNRPSKTSVSYLPYPISAHSKFQNAPFNAQKNYYLNIYNAEGATAYTKTVSYSDQGMPTTKSFSPGKVSVGQERGTIATTNINSGGEVYKITYANGSLCRNGTYPAGTLMISRTVGQHGQETITYSDMSNRLLCKKAYAGAGNGNNGWFETYYVYNEMGKLIYIIPPKASLQFVSNTCLSDIDKLCYSYQYNKYGEVTGKTTPGKSDPDVVVYDHRHRPVLTQNALLRDQNKFTFSIYDNRGRVAMSGIFDNGNYGNTAEDWQALIDANNTAVDLVNYFLFGFGSTYPSAITDCDIQIYNYYDTYTGLPAPASGVTFTNAFANDYLSGPQMIVPQPYYYTYGKLLASRVKVLDNNSIGVNMANSWITSVFFYDEQGRVIQSFTQNPWNSAWDTTTVQYDFAGNTVLSISSHNSWAGTNKTHTKIQTWNDYYANSGLLSEVKQKIDDAPWKSISMPRLDNIGRVTRKSIGGTVEDQYYTYNIRGQLTGINKDYKSLTTLPQGMSFAEELSYENGFTDRRFDGAVSGFQWRTQSTPLSAYGYQYDVLGRMTSADYRDYSVYNTNQVGWNKVNRDFSVAAVSYDINGNMKTMKQYGYDNSMQPALIDDLRYDYDAGNQLQQVTDKGLPSPVDDFNNASDTTAHYVYDNDGNLAGDDLKALTLAYNYQDLPLTVTNTATGGTIQNIYDATGALLQKHIDDGNGDTMVYSYWGPYVYRGDSLLYVLHGEGRARWLPDTGTFKYDFFVKDHLGNVRTVLASDVMPLSHGYLASNEIASAHIEETIFDNISQVRCPKPASAPGDQSELLNGGNSSKRIGAAIILRVMAGDVINFDVYSYHEGKEEDNNYVNSDAMLTSLLSTLAGGSGGFTGGEANNGTTTTNSLFTTSKYGQYNSLKNSLTNTANPRSFLNYVVFNSQRNLVPAQSGAVQVSGTANNWEYLSAPELKIGQNGYIAIYLSNEEAMDVYFDNLSITHEQGRLVEEQHYYPHGLLIGKSIAAGTTPENRFQYQGKEMQPDLGMQLYDFHARQYDPQIGRFWGIDPADQFPSGYTGMGNDPANMVDPSGMFANMYNQYDGSYNSVMADSWENTRISQYWAWRVSEDSKFGNDLLKADILNNLSDNILGEAFYEELEAKAWARTDRFNASKIVINQLNDAVDKGNLAKGKEYDKAYRLAMNGADVMIDEGKVLMAGDFADEGGQVPLNEDGSVTIRDLMYDLPAFRKFFEDHQNEKATVYGDNNEKIKGTKFTVDGKAVKQLTAEVKGNLVLKGNLVTVGKNTGTSHSLTHVFSKDGPASEDGSYGYIHTHGHVGVIQSNAPTGFGGFWSITIDPGPSKKDMQNSINGRYFNVVVDPTMIYIYKGFGQQHRFNR